MVRIGAYVDLGFMLFMCQWRYSYGTVSLLYFSARRSCIIKLEIPGYDEGPTYQIRGDLETRRAKLTRGKGRAHPGHGAGAGQQAPSA